MKYVWSPKKIDYDGSQLRSHWILDNFGISGDAIAAFKGATNVRADFMVDLEDLHRNASIYSEEMLHFIVEHFAISLREAVLRQRILICIIKETLEKSISGQNIRRDGDDLYLGTSKLTISIATKSPLSGLIHAGINISRKNTPVKTKGLKDFKINPKIFACSVIEKYKEETDQIEISISKVRWVY